MFCIKCGNQIGGNHKFCFKCGTKATELEVVNPSNPVVSTFG